MLKYVSGFLLASLMAVSAAQAADYNQWQLMPPKKSAAEPAAAPAGGQMSAPAAKKRRQRAGQVRLVNVKDKNHKFTLACRANSGRLQMLVVFGGGADRLAGKTGATTLSLMVDGKSVLNNSASRYRRAARGNVAVRTVLQGEAMTDFLSRFLAAKKVIAVSYGKEAAESYTVTKASSNGLALQACLLK